MCNYRFGLTTIESVKSTGIEDHTGIMKAYSATKWFQQQSAVWNDKFRPEFVEFLGVNGIGYSFNMLRPEMLYREK
jgi:hypothetical protein